MKCGFCQTTIDRPLELYDGRWCCPNCKKDIFPDTDSEFVIDALNQELFVRSQEYYFKWLTSKDEDKKTRFRFLDKAVSLCCECAFRSHPRALMRMGYYYENGYIDFNKSQAERWIVAYFYYKAVCFNVHRGIETPSGSEDYIDEITQIKLECAKRLANMLKKPPREVAAKGSFDGYVDFDAMRQVVLDKIKELGGEYDEGEFALVGKHEYDNADIAFAALRSCFDEERAPVFGIFKLSCNEAKKLFVEQDNKGFSILEKIGRDTKLKIAEIYDDKEIQGKFYEFKNSDAIISFMENCPQKGIYICFFNSEGGHKYLKKRQINAFAKSMSQNNNAYIKQLIAAQKYNSSVFYDDDIYRYTEKHITMDGITQKFIAEISEEEKNN